MEYIHEQPDWPKLHWNEAKLSPLLADVRHRQGRLLGRMEGLGFRLRTEAQLTTLTSDVVKSSAIEGEKLNAEEVRSSIARRLGLEYAGTAIPSRDVEGIVEMMLDATQNYAQPLTSERLFGWHAALFPTGRSGMHRITVGAWRPVEAGAMQVVSGPIGRENVHFVAPSAGKLEGEMQSFLDWFEARISIDPVLKSGVAHLWFVTIHPFEDGNGRIGRAIADLALARADGAAERFYSMSTQIEAERKEYYLQLERTQRGTLDVTGWLEWFLGCLGRAIERADEALSGVMHKARAWEKINAEPLNERQRQVINRLLDGFEGKLTTSKYAKLAKCSEDTSLRDIKMLVERGVLAKNGAGGRSTSYSLFEGEMVRDTGFEPVTPTMSR
ncbi:Fic family protein [Prosthecobacter sp.]|uniref:Fic family protein n=1 Tax=Prosthecobacter sp. TaxID=1965333 RepID=UPI002ABA419A|nr:Fic family protein [Prosthecobacter sp.]MDZ4404063.1 Fic family protein [Prosthecobacter sp.]